MAKSILLVDPYRGTRALIRGYLQAEMGEALVEEADSLNQAAQLAHGQRFDVVIWSDRLPGIDRLLAEDGGGPELLQLRRRAPFLMLFHTPQRPERIARFAQGGLDQGLHAPFTQEALAARVEELTPAREMRAAPRHAAPGSLASLEWEGIRVEGELINFSLGGFMCEMMLEPDANSRTEPTQLLDRIFTPSRLEEVAAGLRFPEELGGVSVEGLTCQLVALRVMSRRPDGRMERLRLRWRWLNPPVARIQEVESILDRWRAATLATC